MLDAGEVPLHNRLDTRGVHDGGMAPTDGHELVVGERHRGTTGGPKNR